MNKRNKIILLVVAISIVIIGCVMLFYTKSRDYDIEEIKERNYYPLYQSGKIGIINTKGEVLIDAIYDDIQIPNPLKPVFICLSNYNSAMDTYNVTIRNDKNQEIFTEYDEISSMPVTGIAEELPFERSALKYKKDNKYGLLNFEGKEITQNIYEEIESLPYKEGEFLVKKDGKYGVINPKGTKMLKIEYDNIIGDGYYDKNYKNAGYIAGTKGDNGYIYSYINSNGKMLLKKEFNDISRITSIDGNDKIYLIASKNGKKGLFVNEKEVIECEYQDLVYNEELKVIIAQKNDKYGVFDLNGKNIIPVANKDVTIKGIHIITTNNNQTKTYDVLGEQLTSSNYKSVSATSNEEFFITVNESNRYGLINKKGIEVIENKYAYLEYLTSKYFAVYSDDNKIGVVDNNGRIILDMKYDVIQKIKGSNIIQAIELNSQELELYSENMEKIVTKGKYSIYVYDDYIKLLSDNSISYFELDGTEKTNKEILPENKLFAINKNGLWGFEDKDGNIVVKPIYESVTEFNKYGFAGIKKNNKWGILDSDGNIIVNPIYTIDQRNVEPDFLGKYYKINYDGESYYTSEVK